MSKSGIVKKEILEILKDGQEHNVYVIKEYLRKRHDDFEITEGIFSNSFRTLTLAGKIRNTERGVYQINFDTDKENTEREKDNEISESKRSKECMQFEIETSKIINRMKEEFSELANGINIMAADEETVSYIMKVRHALAEIEKTIKHN